MYILSDASTTGQVSQQRVYRRIQIEPGPALPRCRKPFCIEFRLWAVAEIGQRLPVGHPAGQLQRGLMRQPKQFDRVFWRLHESYDKRQAELLNGQRLQRLPGQEHNLVQRLAGGGQVAQTIV